MSEEHQHELFDLLYDSRKEYLTQHPEFKAHHVGPNDFLQAVAHQLPTTLEMLANVPQDANGNTYGRNKAAKFHMLFLPQVIHFVHNNKIALPSHQVLPAPTASSAAGNSDMTSTSTRSNFVNSTPTRPTAQPQSQASTSRQHPSHVVTLDDSSGDEMENNRSDYNSRRQSKGRDSAVLDQFKYAAPRPNYHRLS